MLDVKVNLFLLLGILVLPLLWLFLPRWVRGLRNHDVELQINLGGIGTVTIKPNYEVRQIAHKAWVELKTRKAGLPIDQENDVISDIYDSWYKLFGEIRTLARDVPASKLGDRDTAKLVNLLIESLNNGLRPHLTRWRARYSRWYERAVKDDEKMLLRPKISRRITPSIKS